MFAVLLALSRIDGIGRLSTSSSHEHDEQRGDAGA
jgi:hypothetical protein